MDVNFELYKIFYQVARTGSFSLAADYLYISQSAVSQNIKHLEDKLGAELFFRKSRQVQLTPEGELLFQYIEQAYQLVKTAENQLEQVQNMEAGEIRIGASDTICKYFLLPYLQSFRLAYPRLKITVVNRTSPQIREALKNGRIDLGIVTLPQPDGQLRISLWQTMTDIFVAAEPFMELREQPVSLAELAKYPLLLLERSSVARQNFDRFLQKKRLTLTAEMELESNDLLVDFARIGFGIAYVLRESSVADLEAGRLFEVKTKEKLPARQIGIITLDRIPLPKSAQRFIELLLAKNQHP